MMIHPEDRESAPGISRASAPDEAADIESGYRQLLLHGLSEVEAGNVVAYVAGLHPVEPGWTVGEVKDLSLIRALVACGVIES